MGECILTKSSGMDTGSLTAVAANVLAGKTAYVKGSVEPTAGTMPNRGNVSQALNAGQAYTIPAGYHAGAGRVTANSLASQTQGTAGAYQILSNYVAWVNGSRTVGTNPGYDAGVAAADGRANPNSVNYQSGYNAGVAAGQAGRMRYATGNIALNISTGGGGEKKFWMSVGFGFQPVLLFLRVPKVKSKNSSIQTLWPVLHNMNYQMVWTSGNGESDATDSSGYYYGKIALVGISTTGFNIHWYAGSGYGTEILGTGTWYALGY